MTKICNVIKNSLDEESHGIKSMLDNAATSVLRIRGLTACRRTLWILTRLTYPELRQFSRMPLTSSLICQGPKSATRLSWTHWHLLLRA
ncbi:MAG: hypothetical protein IJT58_02720 [Synergistaceae bacterium]|nr:hypothetical protein [Synergistaceae bacterium]